MMITMDKNTKTWLDRFHTYSVITAGFDTTVLVDVDGFVTEGPGFNVGIVKDGVIKTADKNVQKVLL